jgi:hypothetical protein
MASKVPGAAVTPRGRMLHFILPAVFFSSRSHHSFCAMLSPCVGGTQLETVSTVCAPASGAARTAAAARERLMRFMGVLLSVLLR